MAGYWLPQLSGYPLNLSITPPLRFPAGRLIAKTAGIWCWLSIATRRRKADPMIRWSDTSQAPRRDFYRRGDACFGKKFLSGIPGLCERGKT